jgi:hypothetical protein
MDFIAEIKQVEQLVGQTLENMTLPPEGSSLVDIIMHTTRDFHSEKTGGSLHKISLGTAHIVAGYIMNYADKPFGVGGVLYKVHYPYIAAAIAGESCFDPFATNPNNQNGKPGDSQMVIDGRTDYGLGQINGQPQYYANIPLAVEKVMTVLAQNLVWALGLAASNPLDAVDSVTALEIAAEAYNKGQLGAMGSTDFTYAAGVIGRYEAYCGILKLPVMAYPLIPVSGAVLKNETYSSKALSIIASEEYAKWVH